MKRNIRIKVERRIDIDGVEVITVISRLYPWYSIEIWDGDLLPSGFDICVLKHGDSIFRRKFKIRKNDFKKFEVKE